MHPQIEPSLVRIMACRLLGAKPLSEPMMAVYLLVPWEQFSVKFESKYCNFLSRKCFWKYCLRNGGHFVSASMCYHCPRWHPGGIVEYITGFHWVWCRLFSYWNSLSNQTLQPEAALQIIDRNCCRFVLNQVKTFEKVTNLWPGLILVCAQPMRDGVTL